MAFWTERILPRLVDRALQMPEINARRAEVCQGLHGRVLEIGFGSGLNLRYLPSELDRVLAVEPSELAWQLAQPRVAARSVPVERIGLDGEQVNLPEGSVDGVLSTFTLCTIPDVQSALAEVRRVLKPGGALHFLEHGRSPDPAVLRWQHRLHPVHSRLVGGCNLDRPIDELITSAGLEIVEIELGYGQGPRPFSFLYRGRARRAPAD
jgi:ubiquinone/menaquinone biosynthesis C-methylase UbiE